MNYLKNTLSAIVVVPILSGLLFASCGRPADLHPVYLRTEYKVDPVLDTPHHRLRWELLSDIRGQVQTAWQVLVASSPGLLTEEKADLWNSGKDYSYENNQVIYGGKPLSSRDICYWKIRGWDKNGEAGLEENTLVVFMSDNGGFSWQMPTRYIPITSNTPLKGGKAQVFEAGIRVPLVFSWKGKIKPGQWSDIVVDANDIFPTLVEVAGHQTTGVDIDGNSLVTLWSDPANKKNSYQRNKFFWHYPFNVIVDNPDDGFLLTPHSAIRKNDYKLIFDWHGRLKLYNVREDISETTNLLREKPELTSELFAELIDYLENNVEKRYWASLNPDYDPATEVRDVSFIDLYTLYKEGKLLKNGLI